MLIVASATSLYLESKRLFTLADGAALVGAESFALTEVTLGPDGPRPLLHPGEVQAAVRATSAATRSEASRRSTRGGDDRRRPEREVTVSAVWRPPVVTLFVPEGLRIEATATARSVFG